LPRFDLGSPSFISDFGFGGVLNAARKATSTRRCVSCLVKESLDGFALTWQTLPGKY